MGLPIASGSHGLFIYNGCENPAAAIELYLENVILPWTGKYQTEYNIRVNKRNPQYEYPGFLNATYNVPGIYSKKDPFEIISPGHAEFHYYATGTPVTPAFQYGAPKSTDTTRVNEPLYICCTNYLGTRISEEEMEQTTETNNAGAFLKLFPNPSNGNELQLNYKLNQTIDATVSVLNIFGEEVYRNVFYSDETNKLQHESIDISYLPSGMYVVFIGGINEMVSAKLLIIK